MAPLTATVIVALSVVVPLLDGGWQSPVPVLESEHDTHCVVGHDHTICTQATANRALPGVGNADPPPLASEWSVGTAPVDVSHPRTSPEGHRSRAPPLARA